MKKAFIYTALATTLFASCSSEVTPITPKEDTKALGIKVNIDTKAIKTGSAFASGETIGVYIVGAGYSSTKTIYTCPAEAGDWVPGSPIYLSNVEADVYGFYPSALVPDMVAQTVPVAVKATQTINAGVSDQEDYLYTKSATKVSNADAKNSVTLAFKHSLSQLNFIINKDASYVGGSGSITSIELSSGTATAFQAADAGTLSLADGALTLGGVSKLTFDTSATPITANPDNTGTTVLLKALVAPLTTLVYADADKVLLKVKVDGKDMNVYLPVDVVTSWVAGFTYTYTLTIKGANLIVASANVTIQEWDATTPAVPADLN